MNGNKAIYRHHGKLLLYLWYEWQGGLMRITDEWLKGPELKTVEDITENIMGHLYWAKEDAVPVSRTANDQDRDQTRP
jgi:hypothetical protein